MSKKLFILALLGISTLANAGSFYDPSGTTTSTDPACSTVLFCNLPDNGGTCTSTAFQSCDAVYDCYSQCSYGWYPNYNNSGCQGGNNLPCNPPPVNCPDAMITVFALGLALLALELSRRKFAPAKLK